MPEKITFNQIVRNPTTWSLIIITSLLWIAVTMFVRSDDRGWEIRDEELKGCRAEVVELRRENARLNAEKEDIYKALLYQQGINLIIESKLDSIN